MTQRWQYLVSIVKPGFWGNITEQRLQEELDRQGHQGWELVQVVPNQHGWGSTQLVFKKPS